MTDNTPVTLSFELPEKFKKGMSHRHEAIMVALLEHPDLKIWEIADLLGYSRPHVYMLTSNDAFRAKFAELRGEVNDERFADITMKLEAIAHTSLDKLMEELHELEDPGFLLKTATQTLRSLGYGTPKSIQVKAGGNARVQVVDASLLAQARAARQASFTPELPAPKDVDDAEA